MKGKAVVLTLAFFLVSCAPKTPKATVIVAKAPERSETITERSKKVSESARGISRSDVGVRLKLNEVTNAARESRDAAALANSKLDSLVLAKSANEVELLDLKLQFDKVHKRNLFLELKLVELVGIKDAQSAQIDTHSEEVEKLQIRASQEKDDRLLAEANASNLEISLTAAETIIEERDAEILKLKKLEVYRTIVRWIAGVWILITVIKVILKQTGFKVPAWI